MILRIKSIIESLSITVWQITDTIRESAELFYIRKDEDLRRSKLVRDLNVIVYRDFEADGVKMRGSSSVVVFPQMTDDEIAEKLSCAYENAKYVKNPYFELADPIQDHVENSDTDGVSLMEKAEIMADALFMPDTEDIAFINSAEIFATSFSVHILSSRGVDVSYSSYRIKGEFVVQATEPEDVEMYHDFEYTTLDTFAISGLSMDALSIVRDRAYAGEAPKAGAYDLILTKKHVYTILTAYLEKADAAMIYAKYSPYQEGMNVQGDEISGEKLNITLIPDEPFSPDGVKMPKRVLICKGMLSSIHGNTRFCRYLGIEPRGSYSSMLVENGSEAFESMKAKPYLMPVAFSDFQMDPLRGRFAGEIRLAYLFDGERIHLVTGGSVSGSLLDKQKELIFSKERYTDYQYDGPLAVRIPSVTVAGE